VGRGQSRWKTPGRTQTEKSAHLRRHGRRRRATLRVHDGRQCSLLWQQQVSGTGAVNLTAKGSPPRKMLSWLTANPLLLLTCRPPFRNQLSSFEGHRVGLELSQVHSDSALAESGRARVVTKRVLRGEPFVPVFEPRGVWQTVPDLHGSTVMYKDLLCRCGFDVRPHSDSYRWRTRPSLQRRTS